MKQITALICFCFLAVWAITGNTSSQVPPDTDTHRDVHFPYEDYLIIKYLLHLHAFEKAEALIDKFLEKHPHDPFILTEKAWLAHKVKNNPDEALKCLKKSKTLYPNYYYSNYLLASVLLSQYTQTAGANTNHKEREKKVEEALKYLDTAAADNPEFHDGYFLQGVILSERGKYVESNRAFERASRLKETAESYDYMAYNYNRLNDTAGEILSYQKILELNPFDYRALRALSQIYLEKEDFKQAAHYLEKLYSRNPDDQKLSFEYLYSLFAAGEIDKFMELTKTIDVSSKPMLTYAKALILSHRGKFDEAEQLLKAARNLDTASYILLADIYLRKQEYYQAYQVIEKIENPRGNPMYYSTRLHTLAMLNMNQRIVNVFKHIREDERILGHLRENDYYTILFAYAHLDQADNVREVVHFAASQLKEKSKSLLDLIHLLRVFSPEKKINASIIGKKMAFDRNIFLILTLYKNQHQYENAVALLKELCKEADNEDPYVELCDIYREQGHLQRAEKMIKKLQKRFPDSTLVKNYYAYFLALQNKNLEHALQLSADTLASTKGSTNPAYLDTYGYILFRLGRLPEATKYLEKAYQKHPFEEEIMEHLVDCYKHSQNKENSRIREIYQKAIDNGVDFKDQLIKKIQGLKNKK
ncbi:MAG: tetratricopeptide repeat protein [Candidatus Aminicenantes bacterium]|nr:tetratricopeptide repeat protein [Candidatus Aminicenantes bacterium]NIM80049.1 tetratricopeptide repeat protein [Candidatus Aminicenantes bacterium]NIN19392.1 tetratricopeptide repeat protein [Candidatus Aminicenantes bacterium]NIN43291.1 tetratricopeptide repeat protein [Candidatus Aminicenantes bacterium]NIN86035.1 tetratricopeptide repeat protein [Candidatus Aminicenantes bacterium]